MGYLASTFVMGLMFSVLCGACSAALAMAFKLTDVAPVFGVVVGLLVLALYGWLSLRKQKALKEKAPAFDTEPAFTAEVSAHFLKKAYRGTFTLYVFADRLHFFSPFAPASLQSMTFPKAALAFDRVLVSDEDEEQAVYDLLMYEGKEQTAQLHVRARLRTSVEEALKAQGYFDAPLPQLIEE